MCDRLEVFIMSSIAGKFFDARFYKKKMEAVDNSVKFNCLRNTHTLVFCYQLNLKLLLG